MKMIYYVSFLLLLLTCSACIPRKPDNIQIPSTDIIYQAINYRLSAGMPSNDLVGFVNADGSGNVLVKLRYRPSTPVIPKDWGGILFRVNKTFPLDINEAAGAIFYLKNNGNYQICNNYIYESYFFPLNGTKYIVASSSNNIDLIDVETCKIIKTLIEIPSQIPWVNYIGSATPSDNGSKVVFYEYYRQPVKDVIYIVDVQTGRINEILEGGYNPSLSPDGERVAYIGKEGIYVSEIDGSATKLLVPITFDNYRGLDPHPFWSSDGMTLVFHKCNNKVCKDVSDFSIYKVNVNTAEEVKVIDGGLFPSWAK